MRAAAACLAINNEGRVCHVHARCHKADQQPPDKLHVAALIERARDADKKHFANHLKDLKPVGTDLVASNEVLHIFWKPQRICVNGRVARTILGLQLDCVLFAELSDLGKLVYVRCGKLLVAQDDEWLAIAPEKEVGVDERVPADVNKNHGQRKEAHGRELRIVAFGIGAEQRRVGTQIRVAVIRLHTVED